MLSIRKWGRSASPLKLCVLCLEGQKGRGECKGKTDEKATTTTKLFCAPTSRERGERWREREVKREKERGGWWKERERERERKRAHRGLYGRASIIRV